MVRTKLSFLFILWAAVLFSLSDLPAKAQNNDPMSPFQFLIGNWSGTGSGKPQEAISGSTSFTFELDRKTIVRKNRAEYAQSSGNASRLIHEDLMVIYQQPEDRKFYAMYFDNEGHVIRYNISFPVKQPSVVFESDAVEKAPRFRLVYELGTDGDLMSEFFIAPPGGEFKLYVKGAVKKVK